MENVLVVLPGIHVIDFGPENVPHVCEIRQKSTCRSYTKIKSYKLIRQGRSAPPAS